MKKSAKKILLIVFWMFVFGGLNNRIFARNLDSTKINSTQIANATDSLKNQSDALPQKSNEKNIQKPELTLRDWIALGSLIVGLSGLLFGFYQYLQRRKIKGDEKLAQLKVEKKFKEQEQQACTQSYEEMYRATLAEEFGSIRLLGSPDIESIQVDLDDAFVSLHISETWRSEKRFNDHDMPKQFGDDRSPCCYRSWRSSGRTVSSLPRVGRNCTMLH